MPSYTAKAGDIVYVDSSAGWTITLPLTPKHNDRVGIFNKVDDPSLVTIVGAADTFNVRLPDVYCGATFVFSDVANEWIPLTISEPVALYLSLSVNTWTPGTLGAAWTTVQWDGGASIQRHINFLPPSQFQFRVPGIYSVSVVLSMQHNEVNGGRETGLRFYNATTATPVAAISMPTGRNSPGTLTNPTFLIEVTEPTLSDLFQVQIGGNDAYSAITFSSFSLSIVSNSERLVI